MKSIYACPATRTAPVPDVKDLTLLKPAALVRIDSGDETEATAFGRRLRSLRQQVGLSQKQLAHFSALSVRAIRDLENGRVRQPRADTLRLLAGALGLDAPQMDQLANEHSLGFLAKAAEPAVSGPFIGREHELVALTTMLGADNHRLVTVTGIEGVGKTRLTLEVAHALEAAEQLMLLWLPLDDERLNGGRASTGVPEQPSCGELVRAGTESRRRLVETIGESSGLLVLDGARPEHELADLTTHLVAACPRLRILVTTRDPAGMPLDSIFPLAPLPVPASDAELSELEHVESVVLLLAQTKRIQPAFHPDPHALVDIARICRALDGLPAALESAAHWSSVYSPRQLAHQLTTEPLTIVRRPHDGQQPDAFASIHHTVRALSDRQRDILATMSDKASSEPDGYWSVPDLADTLGLTAAECADDIYRLLILGLLRRVDHLDMAMFRPLNIVSIARPGAAG